MADTNKVKFGLKNLYYAKITAWTGAVPTYATPVAIPGAVSLSLDPEGENSTFYADDMKYFVTNTNNGYQGTLEVAKFPDSFYSDIFGDTTDSTSGGLVEDAAVEPNEFALLCEFKGDKNKTRHVLYRCTCTRPSVGSATTEAGVNVQTESTTITAIPLPADTNGKMFVKMKVNEADTGYSNFFSAVILP